MYIAQMSFMLWQVNVHSKSGDRQEKLFRYHNLFATKKLVGIFDLMYNYSQVIIV